jgi:hypothetical protein
VFRYGTVTSTYLGEPRRTRPATRPKPITLAVRDYSVWAVWEKESLRTRATRAAGQRGSQPGSRPGRSHDVSATGYGVSVA